MMLITTIRGDIDSGNSCAAWHSLALGWIVDSATLCGH
jgi:hypothetical protein